MRAIRFTTLMLLGLLLTQGSGVLASMHGAAHRASDRALEQAWGQSGERHQARAGCDTGDHHPAPPRPWAPFKHKDCSICLGLSLLHLSTPPCVATIAPAPLRVQTRAALVVAFPIHRGLVDSPARAPPSC